MPTLLGARRSKTLAPKPPFSDLAEASWGRLYSVAFRMLGNHADAEDAVQDAFLSACRSYDSFRGEAAASTWLHSIVVNACLMKVRKARKSHRDAYLSAASWDSSGPAADDRLGPEAAALNGELHQHLQQGLSQLPGHLRAAVVLRDVQGFSTDESAEVLGVSKGTFKMRLHRGRLLMRRSLIEQGELWVTSPSSS